MKIKYLQLDPMLGETIEKYVIRCLDFVKMFKLVNPEFNNIVSCKFNDTVFYLTPSDNVAMGIRKYYAEREKAIIANNLREYQRENAEKRKCMFNLYRLTDIFDNLPFINVTNRDKMNVLEWIKKYLSTVTNDSDCFENRVYVYNVLKSLEFEEQKILLIPESAKFDSCKFYVAIIEGFMYSLRTDKGQEVIKEYVTEWEKMYMK